MAKRHTRLLRSQLAVGSKSYRLHCPLLVTFWHQSPHQLHFCNYWQAKRKEKKLCWLVWIPWRQYFQAKMKTKPKEPKLHMKGFVIKQKSLLLATDKENKRFFKCNYHINASSWEFLKCGWVKRTPNNLKAWHKWQLAGEAKKSKLPELRMLEKDFK